MFKITCSCRIGRPMIQRFWLCCHGYGLLEKDLKWVLRSKEWTIPREGGSSTEFSSPMKVTCLLLEVLDSLLWKGLATRMLIRLQMQGKTRLLCTTFVQFRIQTPLRVSQRVWLKEKAGQPWARYPYLFYAISSSTYSGKKFIISFEEEAFQVHLLLSDVEINYQR